MDKQLVPVYVSLSIGGLTLLFSVLLGRRSAIANESKFAIDSLEAENASVRRQLHDALEDATAARNALRAVREENEVLTARIKELEATGPRGSGV